MINLFIWLFSFFILVALVVILLFQVDLMGFYAGLLTAGVRPTVIIHVNWLTAWIPEWFRRWFNVSGGGDFWRLCARGCSPSTVFVGGDLVAFGGFSLELICLADLESDYINPYDSSSRINKAVLPEFILQGFLCLFYLLTGHWVMSLLCAPYLYYNVRLYTRKQHLVDVTEIFNLLHEEKQQRIFKLAYVAVLIFFALFWIICTALEDVDD